MSVTSKEVIARLQSGERAYWGVMGPFFDTNKEYPSASEFDININSAKSLLKKKTIKLIPVKGVNYKEIILS